ncbi:hypothetical protein [Jiella sonneratiae]|uniref:Uncharacterized protein n=1 Tax=Jiella sonneratiae TaxID=2816856 RepID=A0ABS3J1U0_9HYPH|nr:hypothetical protein [Jiella sonneratiae]MBO0903620.1 hypothetical protein [Jiella sonneratiae]
MTSYLIDLLLVVALVVTALRCGRMHKELRALRGTDLAGALVAAEGSLNRAAEALVAARCEGVDTVRSLERRLVEARQVADELGDLVDRARFRADGGAAAASDIEADGYRDFFQAAQDRLRASLAR